MGSGQSGQRDPPPEEVHLSQDDGKIQDITHVLDVKAKARNPFLPQQHTDWGQLQQDRENVRLLKGLFKSLDPAVVRLPGDSYGQLQLSCKYEAKRQLLLVKVIQCRDLRSRDVRTRASAPYVKMQMYPDAHNHGAKTTQIVVETRNPVFNEIFAFRASERELKDARLVAQVWDYDVADRDDFLGEVIINTSTLDLDQHTEQAAWFDLNTQTDLSVRGEVTVTLCYQLPATLHVTVHGAQGLSARPNAHTAHPFVKVAVPGLGALQCSQTQRDTLDPEWEETFQFDISEEELTWRYVVFHVVDEGNMQTENHSMGQAILDLEVMTSRPTFHTTVTLADLRSSDHRLGQRQQQVVTQELREACVAHTATRHPPLLFQPHTAPCKRVKISCRKAGRTSTVAREVRILEGVPVY